MYTTVVVKFN